MPDQIISASGTQFGMLVNSDGSINVVASGIQLSIGSLALTLEDVFVRSGIVNIQQQVPTNSNQNNPSYKFEYDSQNNVGSMTQFIGAGSYVSKITWQGYSGTSIGIGSRVTTIGSWS